MDVRNQREEGTLGRISPYRTRTRTPALFQLIFQWILPPFRTARLANQSPKHKCPLPATIETGPPRQPALCLTGMMQFYIIQFERFPAAGTDRCPPRQPAFCVPEPIVCLQWIEKEGWKKRSCCWLKRSRKTAAASYDSPRFEPCASIIQVFSSEAPALTWISERL